MDAVVVPDPAALSAPVAERARAIRLLACDVDGVLTDGRLQFFDMPGGVVEGKAFSILDGFGVKLLQEKVSPSH